MTLFSVKPRTWTRAEYQLLGETELFSGDRVELFRGEIVAMSPHDPLHSGAVENLNSVLFRAFGETKSVRIQLPFAAPDNSEPEPDAVLLDREKSLQYKLRREHPSEAELIVEVARTSLNYDRLEKLGLYAEAGVEEYWIVNLADMLVERYRGPVADSQAPYGWSYSQTETYSPKDSLEYSSKRIDLSELFLGLID